MVTPYIIGITSAISLYALWFSPSLMEWGMLRPRRVIERRTWHEIFTSGLLHGSLSHLLVNMFVLLVFGLTVERSLGAPHMLALYMSGILVSALPSMWRHAGNPSYATLGASGAVEAVLFTFILLFPFERIYIFLIPIGIPAWLFGIAFLAYSFHSGRRQGGRINHEAHIAGAVWGLAYPLAFIPGTWDHLLTLAGVY
jgi:membrane associated rhomboid family serine protease